MYLPVTYSPATAAPTGMGYFRRMDPELQEAEFYPPPYDRDSPIDLSDVYGIASAGLGHYGMGLFDSADWTTWGWGEWATIGVGLYFGMKLIGDVSKGAKSVRKTVRRRRGARQRKKELQEELAGL